MHDAREAYPTLAAHFWEHVVQRGDAPALMIRCHAEWRELTWGQIAAVVESYMASFEQLESPPVCIASQLPNSIDWIATDLACQTLGLVHSAIDPRESAARAQAINDQCGARLMVASSSSIALDERLRTQICPAERLRQACQVPDSSPAQLLSTSGTCGAAKLVTLSHRNLLGNAMAKLDAAPQFAEDLRLNILPFAHAYARTCELSTWILSGCRLAIAGNWLELVEQAERLQPTLINLVPYLADALLATLSSDRRGLGDRLRLLQVGGAALSESTWHQLREFGLPPLQGYGLTEASPVVCSNRAGQQRPGTIGPPVTGVDIRVDGNGLLWTRGPHVMLGYWKDEPATREAMRAGWLCTGDLVEQVGGLRIVGRQSQQIVLSTGYKVSPEIVEAALLGIVGVEQAVVLGNRASHITTWIWPKLDEIPLHFFNSQPKSLSNLDWVVWSNWLASEVERNNRQLPGYALPLVIHCLPERLSSEAGTLSLKGSPLRVAIEAKLNEFPTSVPL